MSIADQVRCSADPYGAAIKSFEYRDAPHDSDMVTFHFNDQSSIRFKKLYELVNDWIVWNPADKQPPPSGQVRVRFRSGREGIYQAPVLVWNHVGRGCDIVEYFKL